MSASAGIIILLGRILFVIFLFSPLLKAALAERTGLARIAVTVGFVALYSLDLKPDQLPNPDVFASLVDIIEHSPRPLLIEGKWGISRAGLGSSGSRGGRRRSRA